MADKKIKGSKRFVIVLLISFLIVVIGFYFIAVSIPDGKDESGEGEDDSTIIYIDRQASEVSKITYVKGGGEFTLVKGTSIFTLEGDSEFPLDDKVVGFMTNALCKITFIKKIKPDGDAESEYGLLSPHTEIDVTYTDGAKLALKLGGYNKYAEGYYCSVGDGFIYLISSDFAEAFDYEIKDLIYDDTVLPPQNSFSSVFEIEIKHGGKSSVFALKEDKWTFTKADGSCDNEDYSETANHIYYELFEISVDEWVTYKADLDDVRDKYGLKNAEIAVTFRYNESEDFTDENGNVTTEESVKTTVFLIGNSAEGEEGENEGTRYFMFGDGHIVYKINNEDIEATLEYSPKAQ